MRRGLVLGKFLPYHEGLADAAAHRRYDHVLLLDADVPWVQDGTRVLRDQRIEHTERLRRELEATRQPYSLLSGSFVQRHTAARAEIDRVLARSHDS